MADLSMPASWAACAAFGDAYERPMSCVYTSMEAPWPGGRESAGGGGGLAVLNGEGPPDVREATLTLAGALLALSDLRVDEGEGRRRAEQALADGRAAAHFERWCYVQGGRWQPGEFHRLARCEVKAARDGYVTAIDARAVGRAAQLAGAGRQRVDDTVDPAAGVVLQRVVGEAVAGGEPLAAVHSRDAQRRRLAASRWRTLSPSATSRRRPCRWSCGVSRPARLRAGGTPPAAGEGLWRAAP